MEHHMADTRYGIFEIGKDDTPVGGAFLVGPLDECLACISMSGFNEKLLATNEQLSARELALNEREQSFTEQSTKLAHKLADSGSRIVDAYEREQERRDADEQEAKRLAEEQEAEQERERLAKIANDLTPIIGPEGEKTSATSDDGDLEIVRSVEKEKYGSSEDDEYPGDLPRELKKGTPAPSGSYTTPDPTDLGGPPPSKQIAPPTAISLW
jgi:hypothetical protein